MTLTAVHADCYDDVILGSSPLMLLHALYLAKTGRVVCIVDRTDDWGGAWQVALLENGEEVEIACHLIEMFPGVYDFLERCSGVPFEPLIAQPIRVHSSGFKVPYDSRLLLIASGFRLIAGYCKAWVDLLVGKVEDRNHVINFQMKLASYFRYKLSSFFQRPIMAGPRDGFVNFLENLLEACRSEGIHFVKLEVEELAYLSGSWTASGSLDQCIVGSNVHTTTSVNLVRQTEKLYKAKSVEIFVRHTVLVDISVVDVKTSYSYVAFWKDKYVARISRVDTPNKTRISQRFLIEFHRAPPTAELEQKALVAKRLRQADILRPGANFSTVGQVKCNFSQNIDQLSAGEIGPRLFAYHSSGNLAAGIAHWKKYHLKSHEGISNATKSSYLV